MQKAQKMSESKERSNQRLVRVALGATEQSLRWA